MSLGVGRMLEKIAVMSQRRKTLNAKKEIGTNINDQVYKKKGVKKRYKNQGLRPVLNLSNGKNNM